MCLLGYSTQHRGYKCLNPANNRLFIARHVVFDEYSFPNLCTVSTTSTPLSPSTSSPPPILTCPTISSQDCSSVAFKTIQKDLQNQFHLTYKITHL